MVSMLSLHSCSWPSGLDPHHWLLAVEPCFQLCFPVWSQDPLPHLPGPQPWQPYHDTEWKIFCCNCGHRTLLEVVNQSHAPKVFCLVRYYSWVHRTKTFCLKLSCRQTSVSCTLPVGKLRDWLDQYKNELMILFVLRFHLRYIKVD